MALTIDMELLPERDTGNFLSFLVELRAGIRDKKIFSVCVPVRTLLLRLDRNFAEALDSFSP
ncbi:MAG: hypothetical protein LBV68_00885 [Spirochaetaceae bacterium]|nr:hypothetical protein [Spirochaetaceae bacterium]